MAGWLFMATSEVTQSDDVSALLWGASAALALVPCKPGSHPPRRRLAPGVHRQRCWVLCPFVLGQPGQRARLWYGQVSQFSLFARLVACPKEGCMPQNGYPEKCCLLRYHSRSIAAGQWADLLSPTLHSDRPFSPTGSLEILLLPILLPTRRPLVEGAQPGHL